MMGLGWDRMEGAWWPTIAAGLATAGKGWPREAAAFDLRWWAGQGRATSGTLHQVQMPSARALAKRWGWGVDRALALLEAAWADPFFHSQDGKKEVEKQAVDPTVTRHGPDTDPTATRHGPDSAEATNAENPEKNRQSPDTDPTVTRHGPDSDPTAETVSLPMIASASHLHHHLHDHGEGKHTQPDPAPEPPAAPPGPPAACVPPGPRLVLVPQELLPDLDQFPFPSWTVPTPAYKCITRRTQVQTVLRCVEAIHQRPVNPAAMAGAAREVLGLWRHLEWPKPEDFERDLVLVARACRKCPDDAFRNDVRGLRRDGARWRRDSSTEAGTVCRRGRGGLGFGGRLEIARAWARSGCPPDTGPTAERTEPPRGVYPTPPPKSPEQIQKENDDFEHIRIHG